ncbi:MAG: DNA polymerase III subunit beta [Anaerovoracaceae bacterium]|jgi:DNA polymerase-3 subunit beta
MKFTCAQQVLSKSYNIVSRAVSTRTTIPVLKGILLTVTADGTLIMTASDMDFSIENKIPVTAAEPGSIVVVSRIFGDIIRKLPGEDVTVTVKEDSRVTVRTTNSQFTIIGMSDDEFPSIGQIETEQAHLSFPRELLQDMIRKTFFSASSDETKGIIVGSLLELKENVFNMVAIDGFRVAIASEEMKNAGDLSLVINAQTLNEINKILIDSEESDIDFRVGDKKAVITLRDTRIVTRLLDGEFISYREIIPQELTTTMVIERRQLQESLERASLMAREGKNNLVRFEITENLLTIYSDSEEGRVREEVIMDKEGEDLQIGFNSKYILDALKAIDDESIVMSFFKPTTPCLIKPLQGEQYKYLILPVRIPASRGSGQD